MRNLLMTTALVMPLSLGIAYAQATGDDASKITPTTESGSEPGAAAPRTDAAGDADGGSVKVEMTDEDDDVAEEAGEAADAVAEEVDEAADEVAEEADEATDEIAEEADEAGAEPTAETSSAGPLKTEQGQSEMPAEWITGATVMSLEGETVGDIEDVIVDKDTGQVTSAVLSVGGFLGFGAKEIAVDWNELQIDYDAQEVSIDLTRQEAEEAPEYIYREQESPPAPAAPAGGTGMGTSGGMGTTGGAGTPPPATD